MEKENRKILRGKQWKKQKKLVKTVRNVKSHTTLTDVNILRALSMIMIKFVPSLRQGGNKWRIKYMKIMI